MEKSFSFLVLSYNIVIIRCIIKRNFSLLWKLHTLCSFTSIDIGLSYHFLIIFFWISHVLIIHCPSNSVTGRNGSLTLVISLKCQVSKQQLFMMLHCVDMNHRHCIVLILRDPLFIQPCCRYFVRDLCVRLCIYLCKV